MHVSETKATRILNPTAIDLGEYVINPYLGCEFSCLYCYAQFNKTAQRKKLSWGSYVEVRINAADLLEKEIKKKKPSCVLLGSTTDCFQPIEKQYSLTKQILKILNENKIFYNILTRSPFITECLELLKNDLCKGIYFTINDLKPALKNLLEPKSPSYENRIKAINLMLKNNIPVTPYFSPIMPWISNVENIFSLFPKAKRIEFEGLNFRLGNITEIINTISKEYPNLRNSYEKLMNDKQFYNYFWVGVRKLIEEKAKSANKNFNIYLHSISDYFSNKYQSRGAAAFS